MEQRWNWYTRPRPPRGEHALVRAPEGEALPLLQAHRRHRVPLPASAATSGASWRASPTAPTTTSAPTPRRPARTCPTSTRRPASAGRRTSSSRRPVSAARCSPSCSTPTSRTRRPTPRARWRSAPCMRLDPRLAPVKVAVLPLSRNPELSPKAKGLAADAAPELEHRVRRRGRHRPPLPPPGRDRHAVLRHRRLRHPRRQRGDRARARHDEAGARLPGPDRGLPRRPTAGLLNPTYGRGWLRIGTGPFRMSQSSAGPESASGSPSCCSTGAPKPFVSNSQSNGAGTRSVLPNGTVIWEV